MNATTAAAEIIEKSAKRVRDAVDDVQLEYSVHPTALMAGLSFQASIITALTTLIKAGTERTKALKDCHLTADEKSGQITFLGFPIMSSGRPDEKMTPVLIDTEHLKPFTP